MSILPMHHCFFIFYLTIIFICILKAYIVRANQNASKSILKPNSNKYEENEYRSLQASNTFSTAITKLTASNAGAYDLLGYINSVAISENRIVVGAAGNDNDRGAAYLFVDPNNRASGRLYSQMAILLADDGQPGNEFGESVDMDGDIIVIGATEYFSDGPGSVYIFRILNNNHVSPMAKILAQNGAADDLFGFSVAIHGNFILVGAPFVEKNGSSQAGSAYLFVNCSNDPNNHDWTQLMQFQPNDLTKNDYFGWSVAINDQMAVIGTSDYFDNDANAAYVFVPVDEVNSLSLWTQVAKLTGPTDSVFGESVAVAGKTIVVGASKYDRNNGDNTGAVFVFTKVNDAASLMLSSWTETTKLLASDGVKDDFFGGSVSISKDESTIVVGAVGVGVDVPGAAYLFWKTNLLKTAVGWTQVGKFVAEDNGSIDGVGYSIAIEKSIVVVSAPLDKNLGGTITNYGSAFVLDTGFPPLTHKPKPAIPWNFFVPLAALGSLILGFLACLLL